MFCEIIHANGGLDCASYVLEMIILLKPIGILARGEKLIY